MDAPRQTIERARALRRRLSLPEVMIWSAIRGRKLAGLRFRRQHPIGPYILDFYCDEVRLAVEIDGQSHEHPDRMRHDQRRTEWLGARDIRTVRLAARDVLSDLDAALTRIRLRAGR